jgi:hypothetical protein
VRVDVKDCESIDTHLAEPDASFMVDGRAHDLTIGLG